MKILKKGSFFTSSGQKKQPKNCLIAIFGLGFSNK